LPQVLKIQDLEPIKDSLSIEKVWEVLTMDEKREMAGYEPLKKEQEFSKQEDNTLLFEAFATLGFLDDELEVISEQDIHYNPFTFAVTEVDKQILDLLDKNPGISVAEIAQATGETVEQTNHRLTVLSESGNIKVEGDDIKVVKDEQPETELITVYKYVERPNVPAARSGSRDFCKDLMRHSDRNYTRQNILSMVNSFGQAAFTHRGGWYHNPNTGITTPYCRHVWRARTVKVKK